MKVADVSWVGVLIEDYEPGIRFFLGVFGPDDGRGHLSPYVMVGFEVADVEEARREFAGRSVEFTVGVLAPRADETQAHFRGPGGALYSLWSPA